ncbi:MAG: hypothetical protein E7330_01140 [Clostridiales bacterium]|nr:hypothetical protein [Clostridiales bacterium]
MKHTMKKANALILAALFVFTLLPMSAMAGVSTEYIGMTGVSFSHNMFIDGTCETEWEGSAEQPMLSLLVYSTDTLPTDASGNYRFPINITLQKPAGISEDALPFLLESDHAYSASPLPFGSTSQQIDLIADKETFTESFVVGELVIHWLEGTDIAAVTKLSYGIFNKTGPAVSAPDGSRVSFAFPIDGVASEYSNGTLTLTLNETSVDQIAAVYTPGLQFLRGTVSVSAPSGTESFWAGSMDHAYFTNGYINSSNYKTGSGYSHAIDLHQINSSDSGITVIPLDNAGNNNVISLYFAWKDSSGSITAEKVNVVVKLGTAKVTKVPSSALPAICAVPADRMARASLMMDRADGAGITFSYSETDGIAKFFHSKTPAAISEYAFSKAGEWGDKEALIPLGVQITAPDGFDTYALIINGSESAPSPVDRKLKAMFYSTVLFSARNGITTDDTDITIKWTSTTSNAVKYELFTFCTIFDSFTWMDKYWAPAPAAALETKPIVEALKDAGLEVKVETGAIKCSFKEGYLPTVAQMQKIRGAEFTVTAPANAAAKRIAGSSYNDTAYNDSRANSAKSTIDSTPALAIDTMCGGICPIQKVEIDGISYYNTLNDGARQVLVQFYDNAGNLITVDGANGEKLNGYYVRIEVEPFEYTIESEVVPEITSPADIPVMVCERKPGNKYSLFVKLYPQEGSNKKYFLKLETDLEESDMQNGVDVYIPYHYIDPNMTYEKAIADNTVFKVKHYDKHNTFKEELVGTPTENGIKFTVTDLSPFVIEAAEGSGSNSGSGPLYGDANCDGEYNLQDVVFVAVCAKGNAAITEAGRLNASIAAGAAPTALDSLRLAKGLLFQ